MANDVIRALEKLKLSGRAFDYDPKSRLLTGIVTFDIFEISRVDRFYSNR